MCFTRAEGRERPRHLLGDLDGVGPRDDPVGGDEDRPGVAGVGGAQSRATKTVDAAGNAVAIWERHVSGKEVVEATERPAGGAWSEPEVVSLPGEEGQRSRVTIDTAGNAVAVWITGDSSTGFVVRSAVRPPGGEWSEPEDVSDSIAEAVTPWLALDASTEAVAIWTAFESGARIVQGAIRGADGEWSAPDDLSTAGEFVTPLEAPDVAIDAAGNAVAVWKMVSPDEVVEAAVRPAGGDWAAPDDLSASGQHAFSPVVAANVAVGAVALWDRSDGSKFRVQAAVRPPHGQWSTPDTLSRAGESAAFGEVALDAAGNAFAVFGRNGLDGPFVQFTGYDFSPPRLTDVRIPSSGIAGEPLTFAVSAFDVFSFMTTWTFGDPGSLPVIGDTVSHVYARPGAYPVTVMASDPGGNTSIEIGAIAIAPKPTNPPPPPRPQLALALRIEGQSLRKLRRTGLLHVVASVNEAASVALSGRAKLRVRRARGGTRTKLVRVFTPKTVALGAASEGKVTLALSKRGRKALRSRSQVRLLIAGEARDTGGGVATETAARILR